MAEYSKKTLDHPIFPILAFTYICTFFACVCRILNFRQFLERGSKNLNLENTPTSQ